MKRSVSKRLMAMGIATVLTVSYTFTDYPGLQSPTIVYAAQDSIIWQSNDTVTSNEVTFGDAEDWTNTANVSFKGDGMQIAADSKVSFTLTLTKEGYDALQDGYLKLETDLFKAENDWDTVVKAGWPQFAQSQFTKNDDGTYSTNVSLTFDQGGVFGLLMIRVVGTKFTGAITYKDVKITKEQEQVLTPQDPTVIGSFDEDLQGWEAETGYEYSNGNKDSVNRAEKPDVSYDKDGKRLIMGLNYSANATSGWSEAKITKRFDEGVQVNNYNIMSFTITYPEKFAFATKIFGAGGTDGTTEIINKQAELVASSIKSIGDGMNSATVKVQFKPNEEPLTSLTLGIVGQNTDFVGNVYIDDVKISQADATENFVKITSKVKEKGDVADISKMVDDVKLVDGNAMKETKALASYLKSLQANNQVLFGHQNTTFRSVRTNGETSDVEDIVGTLPGIAGIDSLSLSGCETSASNQKEALENSVKASKKAYENGAIVTLSSHMPNFTNNKIVKTEDGKYDFTACDFTESKDCSNNCADQILEGGAYNAVYNAYLDMIADYALALQKDNIPILFRPFHENNGNWFWWGSTTSVESYKAIYRYLVDYLKDKGVHNLLYVYSPNGPLMDEKDYLERYPGDEYIDIVAFDYYDSYSTYPAEYNPQFFDNLKQCCNVVASVAKSHGKIPAISETGCGVTRSNGVNSALAITENPIAGHEWYTKVMEVAKETGMPYYLVWANFDDSNFYVPYKYNDTYGQELINDFIDFYNNDSSIFANGTNFYGEDGASAKEVTADTYTNARGYLVTPKDYAVILKPTTLMANIKNANDVEFIVKASDKAEAITLKAAKNADGIYEAALDEATLQKLGKTDVGVLTLLADGKEISKAQFISFNKEKDVAPAYSIDNFEYYHGNDALLTSTYGTPNSAANCNCFFSLDSKNKANGEYGGAFNYTLTYKGSEVWTGVGKALANTDYSKYNAFSMWVNPDGNGQKLVLQFVSNGEEFESYLSDFVKGTKAQYVTIPFSSFKGKQNGTFDGSNITKFAVWCNSIPANYTGTKNDDGSYKVSGIVTFDDIKTVKISDADLQRVDGNGQIITDAPLDDLTMNKTVNVTGVSLDKTSVTLEKGKTAKLTASILPENATDKAVTWASSNSKVATVKDGVITAVAPGTAIVTVTTKDGNKTASCKVTVSAVKVQKVTLNETNVTLTKGQKKTLKASVMPNDATDKTVTWASSNSKVATVKNGVVTAVAPGTATITVTTKDGNKKASCKVTVKAIKVTKITLNEKKVTLALGKSKTLKVTKVAPNNADVKSVTWKSSNSKVAKVSQSGKVTAVGIGKANIYAVAKDGSKVSAKCTITVNPKKVEGVKAGSVKKSSLKLSWKKQSGVTGYKIYRYDSKKKCYKFYKYVKGNQTTISGLSRNKTYKFKVAAYKKVGGSTYTGETSGVKSVKTKR